MNPILSEHGLVTVGSESAWAVTSEDDRFRYLLGRRWREHGPIWLFGMLNPSKARIADDPTVRKCCRFARRGGAAAIIVVNMLAYSATKPRELVATAKRGAPVRGNANCYAIDWALSQLDPLSRPDLRVAAWGRVPPFLAPMARLSMQAFLEGTLPTRCLGTNRDGSPRHPLMLAYATPLVPFGRRPRMNSELVCVGPSCPCLDGSTEECACIPGEGARCSACATRLVRIDLETGELVLRIVPKPEGDAAPR